MTVRWLVLLLVFLFVGCNRSPRGQPATPTSVSPLPAAKAQPNVIVGEDDSPIRFSSMTKSSGIEFVFDGGPTPLAHMPEQNGRGVAILDFDNDSILDLFFVGGKLTGSPPDLITVPGRHRLYRGLGDWRFEEVTEHVGLNQPTPGMGMGCSVGDFDNDGAVDLFVAGYRFFQLWRNNGDGTFLDVTKMLGDTTPLWSTSAAFADLDADGCLDLFVVNYVDWTHDSKPCYFEDRRTRRICSPLMFQAEPDYLFHNLGDGRFEEIGQEAGVAGEAEGNGLAIEIADLNADGLLDVYVANDAAPNALFQNHGGMRFEDVAIPSGVAISSTGVAGASMGVACADFDRNGHLDLFVTNFANQAKDLFYGIGEGIFVPRNGDTSLDLIARAPLGFGTVSSDFDSDGWPDIFVANGHIWDFPGNDDDYQMKPQLLRNASGRRFIDCSLFAGEYFHEKWLGRAVARGDLDNDGDDDLVITHADSPAGLLQNSTTKPSSSSIRLQLIGRQAARQALGTSVNLTTSKGIQSLHIPAGGSFQASHSPIITFAASLGEESRVEIRWARTLKSSHTFRAQAAGELITIIEPQVVQ